jgi:tetratricopeptide (TPR) repeat protein
MSCTCRARANPSAVLVTLLVFAAATPLIGAAPATDPARKAALEKAEQATRERPDDPEAWLKLGSARSGVEDWDGSIAAYRRAIEIDASSARAHHNLGNVYFRRGDYVAAEQAYARALELDPSYLLAAFHHGWTLRQINRAAEAEAAFRHCLELPAREQDRRTRIDCTFGLGSMRHRAGDYASSAQLMEQVIAVFPGHPEARYYLGIAYRQLGRPDDAREQLAIHAKILAGRRDHDYIEKPAP